MPKRRLRISVCCMPSNLSIPRKTVESILSENDQVTFHSLLTIRLSTQKENQLSLKMICSFLILLLLLGNGASGFQTASPRRSPTHNQFEKNRHQPSFSPIPTISLPQRDVPVTLRLPQKSSIRNLDVIQRRASETSSFSITDVLASKAGTLREAMDEFSDRNPWIVSLSTQASKTATAINSFLMQSWWILPMILALVPIYCAVCKGTCASMPHWWPVVRMDYIRQSESAVLVIGGFLLSNIAYFVSGSFLVNRFPFQPTKKAGLMPVRPTRFTMLGVWILLAGVVSTIFHSVQALGSYAAAESLCYVDHGVAISASLYYFRTCGFPSRKVLAIGIAGLAALVFTYPCYAILHSAWHFLSAAAATKWAVEAHARMK